MIQTYIDQMHQALDTFPVNEIQQVINILSEAKMKHRQVFLMGNGGSASTASHFATDLMRNTHRFKVMCLSDNISTITAYANDYCYEDVFIYPLVGLCTPRDTVIGISTSGKSRNIIRAIEYSNQIGAVTIGLTGYGGGELGRIASVHLNIPCGVIEQIEDAHLIIAHMIAKVLREQ